MVRRLALEEPPSGLALWSTRLGLFAMAVALLSVVLVRGGWVEAVPGLVVLLGGLAVALLAILAALGAFIVIWVYGNPGFGRAMAGAFIGVLLIAYPAFVAARGYAMPQLSDVTTDLADPPRFEAIARVRPRGANPVAYAGPEAAQKQRMAFPDITPMQITTGADVAYRAAHAVIVKRKWRIIEERTPLPGRRDGRIEAIAYTPVMGFRDDVVIRVRSSSEGAVLDIRSASRYGRHDFGSNARRVRSLMEDIEEEVSDQPAATR
jgi:uncharacterized protein (DUF1499 family)